MLMKALAADIPNGSARANALKRLDGDLAVGVGDGQRMNAKNYVDEQTDLAEGYVRVRGPLQRAYRALYLIAVSLKQAGAADIDLARLHEREQVEKVLNLLNPRRVGLHLNEVTRAEFLNKESGLASHLAGRARYFGVRDFARDRGAHALLVEFARRLPECAERDAILSDLEAERERWSPKEGAMMVSDGYANPTDRFYREFARIAKLHNRLSPDLSIDLERLYTISEGRKFLDYLEVGFEMPPATAPMIDKFAAEATPVMEERGRAFGLSGYVSNFGPKRLALKLVEELGARYPGNEKVARLREALDSKNWGWTKGDGDMIKVGTSRRAVETAYRAMWAIQLLYHDLSGSEKAPNICSRRQALQFFRPFASLAL